MGQFWKTRLAALALAGAVCAMATGLAQAEDAELTIFDWSGYEVEGFWQTLGVLLIGLPVAVFIATLPIALAQALRAIADVGDTVAAR